MKSTSPFARFEGALGKQHKARTEADIEAGLIEAPPRKPRRQQARRVEMQLTVPPRVTAAAALLAARTGSNTNAIMAGWCEHIAESGELPPIDPEVQISIKIAVGGALSREMMDDLKAIASAIGMEPGCLAVRYIREGLAADMAKS